MRTDYLRYFIDVVTLGSMSAAAKKNFMTPQGISRSISALEADLGCELLRRDSNRVAPTRLGESLLGDARELVEREGRIRRTVLEFNSESLKKSKEHFVCYSSPIFFDTPLFFPASGTSTAIYGKVQFLQRSTPHVVDLLVEAAQFARTDIVVAGGLGLFDLFPDENTQILRRLINAGYEYRPLIRTHDYVLVPSYSTLAGAKALSKAEIRANRMAVASGGGMERAISRHIGEESIYVSSGDSAYRSHLCRMGEAITFVPGTSLVFGEPEGTVAVPMKEPYVIEIGFAARRRTFEEGVLADVIARLRDFYSKNRIEDAFDLLDQTLASSMVTL